MRIGSLVAVGMLVTALAFAGPSMHEGTAPSSREPIVRAEPSSRPQPQRRSSSIRSLSADVDARVLANLLVDTIARSNGVVVSASAGEVNRCEAATCHVPLTVKIADASGPVTLTFAVASAKGMLSDLQHVECGAGSCTLDLILEKGRNTLSLGALDGVAQASGFKLLTVNAVRPPMAGKPKTEWF